MEIISDEQAAALPKVIQNGFHPVRNMLLQLKVGQNLLIKKSEWNWKRKAPSTIARDIERNTSMRFTCFALMDKSGWLITRTA